MSNNKLNHNEMETIAHFISQRSVIGASDIAPGEPLKALDQYLETYNKIIDKLEEYNKTTN